jgi:hypothetical protein
VRFLGQCAINSTVPEVQWFWQFEAEHRLISMKVPSLLSSPQCPDFWFSSFGRQTKLFSILNHIPHWTILPLRMN